MTATINMVAARLRVAKALGLDEIAARNWLLARARDGLVPLLGPEGQPSSSILHAFWVLKTRHQDALRVLVDDLEAALAVNAAKVPAAPLPRGLTAIATLRIALKSCDTTRSNTEIANDLVELFPERCKVDDDGRLELDGEDRHSQLVKALTEARRG